MHILLKISNHFIFINSLFEGQNEVENWNTNNINNGEEEHEEREGNEENKKEPFTYLGEMNKPIEQQRFLIIIKESINIVYVY